VISHSYATGDIENHYGDNHGGFVGQNAGTITDSYATGNVTGEGTNSTGGFVGYNLSSGLIQRSYALGDVSTYDYPTGGFVGRNEGYISDSYAEGDVAAWDAAGFVGLNWYGATVTNSYSKGNVTDVGNYSGGFVSYNYGLISNSYTLATRVATGWVNTGGFAAFNAGTIINCAWYTGSATDAIGDNSGNGPLNRLAFAGMGIDSVSTSAFQSANDWGSKTAKSTVPANSQASETEDNKNNVSSESGDEVNKNQLRLSIREVLKTRQLGAWFDPAYAIHFETKVTVHEGAVYVVDRVAETQLLQAGQDANVDFKQPAKKIPVDSHKTNTVTPHVPGHLKSSDAMWGPKVFEARLPAARSEAETGNARYGTLKNPDANVFMRSPGGEWQSAKDGMVILPGDEIRTAPDAKVKVLLDDGKTGTVEVKEGSLFRIETAALNATTGDKTTLLDLALGKVLVQVQKLQGGSRFEVRTPTALTGVRGTVFEVTVKEKNGT
jgi:hypothetical protein